MAVSHRAINRLVFNTNYVQLEPTDRVAQASNASFDAATFEIWGALLQGAQLIGIDKDVALSPQDFATHLQEQGISVLFLTTALFNQLASNVPSGFRSVRHLLFGGEAVDPKWVKEVLNHDRPERLLHVYGPTESTTFSTWYLVQEVPEEATTIPIGYPISNTQMYLLDAYLQPVPVGVPGELYIGGAGLAPRAGGPFGFTTLLGRLPLQLQQPLHCFGSGKPWSGNTRPCTNSSGGRFAQAQSWLWSRPGAAHRDDHRTSPQGTPVPPDLRTSLAEVGRDVGECSNLLNPTHLSRTSLAIRHAPRHERMFPAPAIVHKCPDSPDCGWQNLDRRRASLDLPGSCPCRSEPGDM